MNGLMQVLTSEAGLSLAITVFGSIWTAFKTSGVLKGKKKKKYRQALRVLEAGVAQTFQTYTEAIKAGREDGKLTEEEKKHARRLARDKARAIARREGLDLVKILGEDYLDVWIRKLVHKLK